MGSGPGAPNSPGAADAPPAERRDLPHTVTAAERGKPVAAPAPKGRESDSQEKPTRQRVQEEGASEGRSVIDRIGVEPPATSPRGESRLTSLWSAVTREPWPTDLREQSRHVGGGNARWCGSRPCAGLALR